MDRVKVKVDTIVYYPPSKGYAILLRELRGVRQLPIIVGVFEAQAIALAIESINMPRPLTHDLFANTLKDLNVKVKEIVITDLTEGTFYAIVALEVPGNGRRVKIDSRPSDAIALALRADAPIYVMENIMEEAGQKLDISAEVTKKVDEDIPEMKNIGRILELQSQLQEAIDSEDYEKAAELRDQISQIEKTSPSN